MRLTMQNTKNDRRTQFWCCGDPATMAAIAVAFAQTGMTVATLGGTDAEIDAYLEAFHGTAAAEKLHETGLQPENAVERWSGNGPPTDLAAMLEQGCSCCRGPLGPGARVAQERLALAGQVPPRWSPPRSVLLCATCAGQAEEETR